MWDSQMIAAMFPNNRLPSEPWRQASDLLMFDYENVSIREQKMARHMMVNETQITWHRDGYMQKNILYDVYPFPSVEGRPCLSVYGGKMVQNWLQLPEFHTRPWDDDSEEEIKENCEDAGFNYTGLQE